MNEPPDKTKLTLTEAAALEKERIAADQAQPKPLYAPRVASDPPVPPPELPAGYYGQPIPEGEIVRHPPHPDQMKLALKPIDHCPPGNPKPTPVDVWDRQGLLDPYARFDSFWAGEEAARTKQDAEIAEQKAKQVAEIARQDAEIARLASWGIPGLMFTFAQLFATPPDWFPRKYEKPFVKWAQENGYPEDLLARREITHIGYERLLETAREKRCAGNLLAVHKKRGRVAAGAKPPPEPNKRRPFPKSNLSKEKVKKTSR
jgi:hypothetical protein